MSANPYKCYDKIIEQLKKVLRETEDFLRKHYENTKDDGIKTVYETLANLDVIDPPIAIGLIDVFAVLHAQSIQKNDAELLSRTSEALAFVELYLVVTLALADDELKETLKCIMSMDNKIAHKAPFMQIPIKR